MLISDVGRVPNGETCTEKTLLSQNNNSPFLPLWCLCLFISPLSPLFLPFSGALLSYLYSIMHRWSSEVTRLLVLYQIEASLCLGVACADCVSDISHSGESVNLQPSPLHFSFFQGYAAVKLMHLHVKDSGMHHPFCVIYDGYITIKHIVTALRVWLSYWLKPCYKTLGKIDCKMKSVCLRKGHVRERRTWEI